MLRSAMPLAHSKHEIFFSFLLHVLTLIPVIMMLLEFLNQNAFLASCYQSVWSLRPQLASKYYILMVSTSKIRWL